MINLCVLCASAVNPAFPTFGCGVAALCLCGEYSFTVNPEEPKKTNRGWKIDDRGSRFPILDPRFSILHPQSSMVLMRVPTTMLAVAEDQRLNHHRHRLSVGKLLADVDEIKITEIDAVDGNNPGAG
jgi:hypothetical protein